MLKLQRSMHLSHLGDSCCEQEGLVPGREGPLSCAGTAGSRARDEHLNLPVEKERLIQDVAPSVLGTTGALPQAATMSGALKSRTDECGKS